MTDLNLRAAQLRLRGLVASLAFAILLEMALTVGAFVLSFSVLRDLAKQAHLPADLAYLFPLIVDGAILGATIAVVVLNKVNENEKGKPFFMTLLVAVVCVSVVGNAYHAYNTAQIAAQPIAAGEDLGMTSLSPAAAALIAVIPPLLVLAFTHGVGILIRAIGNAYREYNAMLVAVDAETETAAYEPNSECEGQVADVLWNEDDILSPAVQQPAGAPLVDHPSTPVFEPEFPRHEETAVEAPVTAVEAPEEVAAPAEMVNVPLTAVAAVAHPVPAVEVVEASPTTDNAEIDEPVADDDAADVDEAAADDLDPATDALLSFIAQANLHPGDKETARRKILDPTLSFEDLAEQTGVPSGQFALRRYRRAEQAALDAGFQMPPLPVVKDVAVAVAVA